MRTRFNGEHSDGAGLTTGLDVLIGLFQPKEFYNSILSPPCHSACNFSVQAIAQAVLLFASF